MKFFSTLVWYSLGGILYWTSVSPVQTCKVTTRYVGTTITITIHITHTIRYLLQQSTYLLSNVTNIVRLFFERTFVLNISIITPMYLATLHFLLLKVSHGMSDSVPASVRLSDI